MEKTGVSFSPKNSTHNKKDLPESETEFAKDTVKFSIPDQCGQQTVIGENSPITGVFGAVKFEIQTGMMGGRGQGMVNGELKYYLIIILDL